MAGAARPIELAATTGAVLRLVRWPNALIAAAGVLVGAWWAGGDPLGARPLLASLCAIALTCLANADNDRRDVAIDVVAHPRRPLASGALDASVARRVVAGATLAALLFALGAGGTIALATPFVIVLMLVYTPWLKPLGLPGNLTVALLASLPFLYGGWSVGSGRPTLALVALAVPLHLARELAKDLEDAEGDAATRRTLPVGAGSVVTRAALVVSLAAFLGVLAAFVEDHRRFALLVAPALLLAGAGAVRSLSGRRGAPRLLKAAMLCAMAALVLSR